MAIKWYVEVNLSNGKALAIGDDYVSGSADLTEADEALIREAGKSLLAFIGEPPNQVDSVCACNDNQDVDNWRNWEYCPICGIKRKQD